MLGYMVDETLVSLIQLGIPAKGPLVEFSLAYLKKTANIIDASQHSPSFASVWATNACSPFREAVRRMQSVCRCFLHFFCAELPAACNFTPTSIEDVHHFSNYSGQLLLEKTLKRILVDPTSWWHGEHQEMLRKGAAGCLVKDKLQELQGLLSSEGDSAQRGYAWLMNVKGLLTEVRAGVRSQKMDEITRAFAVLRCFDR